MHKVITYTRFFCAMAYQMITDILKPVWTLSIALDCGNKSDILYLDIKIRFCVNEVLYNIYLVALPMKNVTIGNVCSI